MLAATLTACSGSVSPGPTAVPLRPTATADFETASLTDLLDQLVAAGAPAALVEVREGDEVWQQAAGVVSVHTEMPAEPRMTFRVASLTKPMVGAIVLQLVDEGRLGLDDRVSTLLPGVLDGPFAEVTVRQLLNHTSGLQDYIDQLVQGDPTQVTATLSTPHPPDQLLGLATAKGPAAAPGEQFLYSNANYIALSMLVEKVGGQSLADAVRDRIATSLGLAHTRIPNGDELESPHVHGYWVNGSVSIDVTKQDSSLWSGAGGVESNVDDINTFFRALMAGLVVPPELLGEMLALGSEGYGLGVQGRVDACGDRGAVTLPLPASEPPVASSTSADAESGADDGAEHGADADGSGGGADGGSGPGDDGGAGDQADAAADDPSATPPPDAPRPDSQPDGDAKPNSGSIVAGPGGSAVQIGDPGYVYGHLGSGLGYRALTFTSPDGVRQVTVAWTASPTDYATDPRLPIAYDLVDAALAVRC